jgi:hypothetical protein
MLTQAATRQQRNGAVNNLTPSLDRFGFPRDRIEVDIGWKPLQQVGELVCQNRSEILQTDSSRVKRYFSPGFPNKSPNKSPGWRIFG